MPGKIRKGNGLSKACCHLSEVRARRLRLDRVNTFGLISSQFHRFPPKTWNRGTPWNSCSTPESLAAQGLRGNRGTVEQNSQKLPRNLHIYITRTNVHIYARSYICCIFCSTVPHPYKNDVVVLVPQRLQPVEHWFHTCSSSSTLQRQVIRIFLVIQLHGGQPQAEAFRGDTIDTLPLGVGTPAGLDQGFLLQV